MRRIALGLWWMLTVAAVAEPAMAQWKWGIGLSGGYETGGKLYRARSTELGAVWPLPDGSGTVSGTEIRAEIDGYASFGVRATLEHASGFGAILSATFSDLDVNVIRRTQADNVEKVPWDQWFTVNTQAVATWSMLRQGNTPYLLAGLGTTSFDSEGSELDQSSLALVLGAGYRARISRMLMVDLELRDSIVGLDLDEEEARLAGDQTSFEAESRVQLIEITASLSLMF